MTANHRALEPTDISLIEQVKLTPALYNSGNPDFRLAHKKDREWEQLAIKIGVSAADARRRFTCLRDRYSRELKQLRIHPDKGEYGKNDFFRLMDFLRPFVRRRRERQSNIMKQYEQWDGAAKPSRSKLKPEESNDQSYEEEESTQDTFNDKAAESATVDDDYRFVEVESETYEEYVDQARNATNDTLHKQEIKSNLPISHGQQNPSYHEVVNTAVSTNNSNLLQHGVHQPQLIHAAVAMHQQQQQHEPEHQISVENEDDFFCKSIAAYLRQLSRRHKIKAKVEMFQILEKYIEIEENSKENFQTHDVSIKR